MQFRPIFVPFLRKVRSFDEGVMWIRCILVNEVEKRSLRTYVGGAMSDTPTSGLFVWDADLIFRHCPVSTVFRKTKDIWKDKTIETT